MEDTLVDNQAFTLKNKIKLFFTKTIKNVPSEHCPVKGMLAGSLDKWSLFILYNLGFHEVMRFNEMKQRIDGISSRMLSLTLKKLESNGLVSRKVYPEVPPKVEYRLTTFGIGFSDKLIDLSQWYLEHHAEAGNCECVTV